jgi:hypothetical protein
MSLVPASAIGDARVRVLVAEDEALFDLTFPRLYIEQCFDMIESEPSGAGSIYPMN